jgi:signal transduction histidine kinase
MRILTFLAVLIVLATHSTAQVKKADSLEKKLEVSDTPTRAWIQLELAKIYRYQDPARSTQIANEVLAYAKSVKNDSLQTAALLEISFGEWSKGNLTEALDYFDQTIDYAVKINNDGLLARAYGGVGNVYQMAEEYFSAMDYYEEALEIFAEQGNTERIIAMYNNLGRGYMMMNQFDSAEHYLYLANNTIDDAHAYMRPILQYNIAELKYEQEKLLESEALLRKAAAVAEQNNDIRGQIRCAQLLAEILLRNRQYEEGLALAEEAAKLAPPTNVKELIYISFKTYANALSYTDQHQAAYDYLNKSNIYKDSIQSALVLSRLKIKEYEKTNSRIQFLEKERQLITESQQRQRYLIYALSVIVLLAFLTAWIYYKSRQKISLANQNLAKNNKQIEQQKTEIQLQANELREVNQLKNKIISIITHDMKGPLIALHSTVELINLKVLEQGELEAMIPELTEKVRSTNDLLNNLVTWAKGLIQGGKHELAEVEIGQIVHNEIQTLEFALKSKKVEVKTTVPENLRVKTNPNIVSIAVRNLISNAIKFSHEAGVVEVSTTEDTEKVVVQVLDHGVGIDPEKLGQLFSNTDINEKGTKGESGSGLGLILIKDLVTLVGGDILISSEQGKGTTARLVIPR